MAVSGGVGWVGGTPCGVAEAQWIQCCGAFETMLKWFVVWAVLYMWQAGRDSTADRMWGGVGRGMLESASTSGTKKAAITKMNSNMVVVPMSK